MKHLYKNITIESVLLWEGSNSLYDKPVQLQGRKPTLTEHILTAQHLAERFHTCYLYYLPPFNPGNMGRS